MRKMNYDNKPVDFGMSTVLPPTTSNPPMPEVKDPRVNLNYGELREEIHKTLLDFLNREIECYKGGEFDFDFMEYTTDDILNLIRRQGGTT